MAELCSDPQPSDEQIDAAARKYHFATDSVPLTPWESAGLVRQTVCRTIARDLLSGLLQELVDLRKQLAMTQAQRDETSAALTSVCENLNGARGRVVVLETALRELVGRVVTRDGHRSVMVWDEEIDALAALAEGSVSAASSRAAASQTTVRPRVGFPTAADTDVLRSLLDRAVATLGTDEVADLFVGTEDEDAYEAFIDEATAALVEGSSTPTPADPEPTYPLCPTIIEVDESIGGEGVIRCHNRGEFSEDRTSWTCSGKNGTGPHVIDNGPEDCRVKRCPCKELGGVAVSSPTPTGPPVTLYINRSESYCGECKMNADPHAETHDKVLGYGAGGPGCGARWTHVSSDYMGMDDRVREMRPDLIFAAPTPTGPPSDPKEKQ